MASDASATDPHAALEGELRVLLRRAVSINSAMARRIHPTLDASAYPLLAHIAEHPRTRGSDLAARFGVGRATISRQLSKLYSAGLVAREVDPQDSRGLLISLTALGAARLAAAQRARVAVMTEALAQWDVDDVRSLASLLHRYADTLDLNEELE